MKFKTDHTPVMTLMLIICAMFYTSISHANEFPGRERYPTVPYLELKDFHKIKNDVVVVDVRSPYEHSTLRVKGALNIPLSSRSYIAEMTKLRKANKGKKIVVYCNGKTCMKSYKAALKCKQRKIPEVYAYDAGIMDWAQAYPADSVLLGQSPIDTKRLISKKTFKTYLVSPKKFENMIGSGNVMVLDVRDRYQRDATGLFPGKENRVYISDASGLDKYISKAKAENKTLLIYDEVGKQVRWLQYYIEGRGLKNYHFMKGGVRNYYKYLAASY